MLSRSEHRRERVLAQIGIDHSEADQLHDQQHAERQGGEASAEWRGPQPVAEQASAAAPDALRERCAAASPAAPRRAADCRVVSTLKKVAPTARGTSSRLVVQRLHALHIREALGQALPPFTQHQLPKVAAGKRPAEDAALHPVHCSRSRSEGFELALGLDSSASTLSLSP